VKEKAIKTIRDGFKKGNIELLVLCLLSVKEMYGYKIVQTLEKMTDGVIKIPEGSVYPILYKLVEKVFFKEEQRLIGQRRQRSYYEILPAGEEQLELMTKEYHIVHEGIEGILNYASPLHYHLWNRKTVKKLLKEHLRKESSMVL